MTAATQIAQQVFASIQAEFPQLAMELDTQHKFVDLLLRIPRQSGMQFEVSMNLQNSDELHLNAASLWVEWFPCTDPKVAAQFHEAVSGLLSGRYRILEYYRGNRVVKASLQRPNGAEWESVKTWCRLHFPFPRAASRVIQNAAA